MANYNYIVDTGVIVADTADVLSDVEAEFRAALGANINLAASTPQGSLVAAEAIARSSVMRNEARIANTINPNVSFGTFLDAICALMGIERGSDLSTFGYGVQVTGRSQTRISTGSRVQTPAGAIFTVMSDVTIPAGGVATIDIKSQEYGNIPLPVGNLIIIDGTIGWSGAKVIASTRVDPGSRQMSDAELKNARVNRLAIQGRNSTMAIKAYVSAVPNVTSVNVIENNTGAVQVVNGVSFTLPYAVWVCVAGNPDKQAVADALWAAHNGGTPWDYGAVNNGVPVDGPNGVPVRDPASGRKYVVKWTTPIMYDGYVNVTVQQGSSSVAPEAIQNAVVNYAQGKVEGEEGLVVGASLSAFEVAGAIAREIPGIYIKLCQVACVAAGSPAPAPGDFTSEYVMSAFGQATISVGNVRVTFV